MSNDGSTLSSNSGQGFDIVLSPNGSKVADYGVLGSRTFAAGNSASYPLPGGNFSSLADLIQQPELTRLSSINVDADDLVDTPLAKLRVSDAYLVRSDVLAIRIDTGVVVSGSQIPYLPNPDDIVSGDEFTSWVTRGFDIDLGFLSGPQSNILRTYDRYLGETLDTTWADSLGTYTITSSEDSLFGGGVQPEGVYRKTVPAGFAQVSRFERLWPEYHILYLDLPTALQANQQYTVNFGSDRLAPLSFTLRPGQTESEAVQISQVGFRPDDPAKRAYLSTWMGSGGGLNYEGTPAFSVIDINTNQVVYSGTSWLGKEGDNPEPFKGKSYTQTDVYTLDFSALTRPGDYRVYVDGIGSSMQFRISDRSWADAFYVSARGFYHQRSGIALEQPYTDYTRPRSFNPADGKPAYQSTYSALNIANGASIDDVFKGLVAGRTDEVIPGAWGGYFDAGDWDRRTEHLKVTRSLLELVELFPDYYSNFNLNIPESSNNLPDVVDEALWTLDMFKRLQKADGGIPGGIESTEHPKKTETSWQDTWELFVFAPDPWSSYTYAGVAARAAVVIERYDPVKAQDYLASALRAMAYAEREYALGSNWPEAVANERNLAALELFRATGDTAWHSLFLQTTAFTQADADLTSFQNYDQRESAALYARLSVADLDLTVRDNARAAILREADTSALTSVRTSFNWTQNNSFRPVAWDGGLGAPDVTTTLRAYALTGDQKYLSAGILGSGYSLGANPLNQTFTTGLGQRSPQNPLLLNNWSLGQAYQPGITLYGTNDLAFQARDWSWLFDELEGQATPNILDFPVMESYMDIYLFPATTELTVHQAMAPMAYTLGFLAARQSLAMDSRSFETMVLGDQAPAGSGLNPTATVPAGNDPTMSSGDTGTVAPAPALPDPALPDPALPDPALPDPALPDPAPILNPAAIDITALDADLTSSPPLPSPGAAIASGGSGVANGSPSLIPRPDPGFLGELMSLEITASAGQFADPLTSPLPGDLGFSDATAVDLEDWMAMLGRP